LQKTGPSYLGDDWFRANQKAMKDKMGGKFGGSVAMITGL
jgi:hypothetical protein